MAATKELTFEQLESSKIFIPDNEIVAFKHPLDYFGSALTKLTDMGAEISFSGMEGSKNQNSAGGLAGEINMAYKRVIMKAVLPVDFTLNLNLPTDFNILQSEIGMLLAFDGGSPEIKVYHGKRVTTCLNKCIFGAAQLTHIELLKESPSKAIDIAEDYIKNVDKEDRLYVDKIERMYNNTLVGEEIRTRIGDIFWYSKLNPKLGINVASAFLSNLQNKSSRYFFKKGEPTNDWMMYNACTEVMKGDFNEVNRALALEEIFLN